MPKNRIYVSEFKNRYGETWRLRINTRSRVGILAGDELGRCQVVRIVDGHLGSGLILGSDELTWIRRAWREATGSDLRESIFQAPAEAA